jgi:hypothetical protein
MGEEDVSNQGMIGENELRGFLAAFEQLPEAHKKTVIAALGMYAKTRGTSIWNSANSLLQNDNPLPHEEIERLIKALCELL